MLSVGNVREDIYDIVKLMGLKMFIVIFVVIIAGIMDDQII
jgi:hypothetical protein